MKNFIALTLLIATFGSTVSSASIIDFTNTDYYASTYNGLNTTKELIDGVNLTFTATARGINGFRQNSTTGLSFGIPGNGMSSLSIVADKDIEYTSLLGLGHTLTGYAGQLPFDVYTNGALQHNNLTFVPNIFTAVPLTNLSVSAGDALLIEVDYSALTGNASYSKAAIQSLNFQVTTASSVPLPSTLWLMMIGICSLLGAEKYIKLKSAT